MTPSAIFPISSLDAESVAFAGGKGAMLGELMHVRNQLSIPVTIPSGVVVSVSAFEEWLDAGGVQDARISSALQTIGRDTKKLQEMSEALISRMQTIPLPSVVDEVQHVISHDYLYAVRSSGIGEDGGNSSFAGQHDTFLSTKVPDVTARTKDVWMSVFNPRALYYRVARNLTELPLRQAVVVQQMVDPEIAGVAFSADPRTGVREHGLIEYIEGLGEDLVSGKKSPKSIVFQHGDIEHEKFGMVHPAILPIAKTLLELQAILGYPVDMEWAWKEGQLYLLQVRPITTLPTPMAADKVGMITMLNSMYGKPYIAGVPLAPNRIKAFGFVTRGQADDQRYDLSTRILLAPYTTPDDLPLMEKVAGIVVSRGGITSHAAIVCRELGKPCIKIEKLAMALHNPRKGSYVKTEVMMDGDNGGIYNLNSPYEVVSEEK